MAPLRPLLLSALTLVALAAPAGAGILENRDAESHRVTFQQGSGRATAEVPAKKFVRFRCSELPCRISLQETGQTLELRSDKVDVVIREGRLVRVRPASKPGN